jgi:nucleoside-triphosphatase THEP1
VEIAGVAQPAVYRDGKVLGYELLDVSSGERRPFATWRSRPGPGPTQGEGGDLGIGDGCELGFRFDQAGFAWAATRLLRPADVLLVDELGWLESRGAGHMQAVQAATRRRLHRVVVYAIREDVLPDIVACLGPIRVCRVPVPPEAELFEDCVSRILKEVRV